MASLCRLFSFASDWPAAAVVPGQAEVVVARPRPAAVDSVQSGLFAVTMRFVEAAVHFAVVVVRFAVAAALIVVAVVVAAVLVE